MTWGERVNKTAKRTRKQDERAEPGDERKVEDLLEVGPGTVALSLGRVVVEVGSFVALRVVEGRDESSESAAASRVGSVEGGSTVGVDRSEVVS